MTYQKPWQILEYGINTEKPITYLEQKPKN